MNSTLRSLVFWIVLILVAGLVWRFSTGGLTTGHTTESFSEFKAQLEALVETSLLMWPGK